MSPIKLLFRLLQRFVPMEDGEFSKSLAQAQDWWGAIRIDEGAEPPKGPMGGILVKYKRWSAEWYGVVAHSILYIFLVRAITDYMSAKDDVEQLLD